MPSPTLLLLSLAFLEAKHFVCDFVLQTPFQMRSKGVYGHPGGFLHAGIHVLGTLPVFLLIAPSLLVGVIILVGEFAVHYHLDWSKEQFLKRTGWTVNDGGYWITLGADQLLHHLTYVAIVAALVFA